MYFIFAVDGDWEEYHQNQRVNKNKFKEFLKIERMISEKYLNNKLVHLIHTSLIEPDIFFSKIFFKNWREFSDGCLGLHCHYDIPNKKSLYNRSVELKTFLEDKLKKTMKMGINLKAYRGGYCSFNKNLVELFKTYNIFYDLSAQPGKVLKLYGDVIANWKDSQNFIYEIENSFYEVPIGSFKNKIICLERCSKKELKKILEYLKQNSKKTNLPVISIMTHSYMFKPIEYSKEFEPLNNFFSTNKYSYKLFYHTKNIANKFNIIKKILKFKNKSYAALLQRRHIINSIKILKNYGEFINLKDLDELVN